MSKEAKSLLQKLLEKDPNRRISAGEALTHEWFQESDVSGVQLASTKFLNELSNYYVNIISFRDKII